MNPQDTSRLWIGSKEILSRIAVEEEVRIEVGPVLQDLSEAFNNVSDRAELSDPLLPISVWALSMLANETISVPGFKPVDFIDGDSMFGFLAPAHDFSEHNGTPINTRLVKLSQSGNLDSRNSKTIEIYGINLYVPSAEEDEVFESTKSPFVVVSASATMTVRRRPAHGYTPIFAIRNIESGVCKLYKVDIDNESPHQEDSERSISRIKRGPSSLTIASPDNRYATVTMLEGDQLQEALGELKKSILMIKSREDNDGLSLEEKSAARATIASANI